MKQTVMTPGDNCGGLSTTMIAWCRACIPGLWTRLMRNEPKICGKHTEERASGCIIEWRGVGPESRNLGRL